MSKKFTKTVLSATVAGVLFGVSFVAMALEPEKVVQLDGGYKLELYSNNHAQIVDQKGNSVLGPINKTTGYITTVNKKELFDVIDSKIKNKEITQGDIPAALASISRDLQYSVYIPELTPGNIEKLNSNDILSLKSRVDNISGTVDNMTGKVLTVGKITSENAATYNSTVKSGGDSDVYLDLINDNPQLANEYNRIVTKMDAMNGDVEYLNKETTFELDDNGNITLDETGSGDRESVKNVVAGIQADTTIHKNDDGSYTMDPWTKDTARVNEAVVDLDTRTRSNTKAIQSNSRQLQEHNARLNSQQRQIRENHEEMKRAAAQSAALSGLFQPYSVGKFNATAALGGYSDKQAVAVGVGYRFNEQTAAKAGIAASEGDVSYNVGVNFEF